MLNNKIFVAGHRGLVGSAILKKLRQKGYNNILVKSHSELDLEDNIQTEIFFRQESFDWVFLSAAYVGGIYANNTYPVEFMLKNLKIELNVIESCFKTNVKKLMFLGSSCIYPKNAPQPIKESYLLSDYLESTNEAYALSKICGLKLCTYYNREYSTNYLASMPCNLYGINDNYHNKNAHVIPMLIRKFHEAKVNNEKSVFVWGTGKPKREFLFADDLASALVFLMENINGSDLTEGFINIGSGKEVSILELAYLIKEVTGYKGEIVFDGSRPDGTMRKLTDSKRMFDFGWKPEISLKEGLKLAYNDFLNKAFVKC